MKDDHATRRFFDENNRRSARILIVEDSAGLNRLIKKRLQREGFGTVQAMTGTDALTCLSEQPVDLILLDYVLPDLSIPQILEQLRAQHVEIPFIIMTGQGDERVAVDMMKLGAKDYIVKRANFLELLPQIVQRTLRDLEQQQRLIHAKQAQHESERRFRETLEHIQQIALMLDSEGRITFCNQYLLTLLQKSQEEVLGKNWFESFLPPEIQASMKTVFAETLEKGALFPHYENELLCANGERRLIAWSNIVLRDRHGRAIGVNSLGQDITEQKQNERRQQVSAEILALLNSSETQTNVLQHILNTLKAFSGVEALGIRLKDGIEFPFYESCGFSENFLTQEVPLPLHEQHGMDVQDAADRPLLKSFCGEVIFGQADRSQPFFSQGGSFWTGDLSALLQQYSEYRSCRHCLQAGYESIALIPLRTGDEIIGLLQLSDTHRKIFQLHQIEFLENIGASIGIAITRKHTESTLQQLQKAVETMHLGVTISDLSRKILYVNPAEASMHGYAEKELLGRPASLFAPPELRQPLSEAEIEQGRTWIRESLNIHREDGSRFPVQLSSDFVRDADGRPTAIVTTCEDITDRKRAEEHQTQERNLLRTLIDNIPDYVFVVDAEGRYLINNVAHRRLLGAENQEETIGSTAFDYFPYELAKRYHTDSERCVRSKTAMINHEEESVDRSGERRWRSTSKIPLQDPQGKVLGLVGISRDITERKNAEATIRSSRQFLQSTLNSLAAHIAIIDEKGVILEVNASWKRFSDENELDCERHGVGENYLQVCDAAAGEGRADAQKAADAIRAVLSRQRNAGHSQLEYACHSPKVRRWFSMRVTCFETDDSLRVVIAHENITERKLAEEALYEALNELESRVRDRTVELRLANERLEKASHMKDEFLANMSHELRTPLNAILGYAQLLKNADNLHEQQREALTIVKNSGEHLLSMINEILNLAKIESGQITLQGEHVHFPHFLKSLTDMLRIRAQQKGINFIDNFASDLPEGIFIDAKRLREVLLNLLGNAIKFTDEGRVMLRVSRIPDSAAYRNEAFPHSSGLISSQTTGEPTVSLRFEVEDTGPGISDDHLQEIFLPFHQVGEELHTMEGTGLGLTISSKLLNLMGSELSLQSTPGQGTHFWFTLTVKEVPAVLPEKESVSPKIIGYAGPARTLLIIDDTAGNRELLSNMLTPLGFKVFKASNAEEGIERVRQEQPELILLDLVMPGMDGFAFIRQLQRIQSSHEMILIAVSASAFEDIRRRSLDAGCHDFLAKPFQLETLLELLNQHLSLEWIYEESQPAETGGDENFFELWQRLPHQEGQKLFELAMRGNVKEILKLLDTFETYGAALLPLTQALRGMAKRFDVDQIVDFVQELQHDDHDTMAP